MSTPTPTGQKHVEPASLDFLGSRYENLTMIGQGGMGRVYKAYDSVLKKWIAIKILLAKEVNDSMVVRFQKEAKLASKLNHPNIVTVLDFGYGPENQLYLVMDFVDGQSLSDLLDREETLEPKKAIELMIALCDGLIHAHGKGVIHRDLKPSNIVLSCDGEVKLLDFGIAKLALEYEEQSITKTGVIMGSPFYMAPEQITIDSIDHRADLYALGCLLFKLLTGSVPFEGNTAIETMKYHMEDKAPQLCSKCDRVFEPKLEDLVATLLSKDKEQRVQTVVELKSQLEELQCNDDENYSEELELRGGYLNSQDYLNGDQDSETSTPENESSPRLTVFFKLIICLFLIFVFIGFYFVLTPSKQTKTVVTYDPSNEILYRPLFDGTDDKGRCRLSGMNEKRLKQTRLDLKEEGKIKSLTFDFCIHMGNALKYYSNIPVDKLIIRHCDITNDGFMFVKNMREIKYLTLENNRNISAKGLAYLTNLPKLKHLAVKYMNVGDKELKVISRLKGLTFINLVGSKNYMSSNVSMLSSMPKLKKIRIGGFDYESYKFSKLKEISNIRFIELQHIIGLTPERLNKVKKTLYPLKVSVLKGKHEGILFNF